MLRSRHDGSPVKSSLGPFCIRIPGPTLPRQFGRVFTYKQNNGDNCWFGRDVTAAMLVVKKKRFSLGTKHYFHVNSSRKNSIVLTPLPFQHGRLVTRLQNNNISLVGLGTLVGLSKIFEMRIGSVLLSRYNWITENSFRAPTKPRYGPENCCKCRLSIFKSHFWPKKSTMKRCNFWWWFLAKVLAVCTLLPNKRRYKVEIGSCNWFVCFHNCKIYHLVPRINDQKIVTKIRRAANMRC